MQPVPQNSNPIHQGLRYNEGKALYDLLPNYAIHQLALVLTKGAQKYKKRNWEKGLSWTSVVASLKRHLSAFERGEDIDPESGLPHMAHILANASFLMEYYKIYPQGDDRPHHYLKPIKVGLDIDEVIADWVGHWSRRHGIPIPTSWNFDREIGAKFETMKHDKEFWMSIPRKCDPHMLPFEPHCYVTSRPIPNEWTEEWLDKQGFPVAPVITIGVNQSKVDVLKDQGVDIYVDDRYSNFVDLNSNGICTYLFDAPHNQRYEVGYKRIYSLRDIGQGISVKPETKPPVEPPVTSQSHTEPISLETLVYKPGEMITTARQSGESIHQAFQRFLKEEKILLRGVNNYCDQLAIFWAHPISRPYREAQTGVYESGKY